MHHTIPDRNRVSSDSGFTGTQQVNPLIYCYPQNERTRSFRVRARSNEREPFANRSRTPRTTRCRCRCRCRYRRRIYMRSSTTVRPKAGPSPRCDTNHRPHAALVHCRSALRSPQRPYPARMRPRFLTSIFFSSPEASLWSFHPAVDSGTLEASLQGEEDRLGGSAGCTEDPHGCLDELQAERTVSVRTSMPRQASLRCSTRGHATGRPGRHRTAFRFWSFWSA